MSDFQPPISDEPATRDAELSTDSYLTHRGSDKKKRNRKRVPGSVRDLVEKFRFRWSRSTIQRSRVNGRALGEDLLRRCTGTSLSRGCELTALSKLPVCMREILVERARFGEKVSARAVAPDDCELALVAYRSVTADDEFDAERYEALWTELVTPKMRAAGYLTHLGSDTQEGR